MGNKNPVLQTRVVNTYMTVFSQRLLLSTALTRVGALAFGLAAYGGQPLGSGEAYALPQQGQVVGGSASIAQAGPSELDITQSSSRAVIDWRSFSIGAGETTRFIQPDASSVAVNRVTGVDPSSIMGRLTANGQVVLVNPNGILFGKGAAVNVGGLVASTAGISTQNAMNGIMVFDRPGQAGATIRNDGTITARTGGLVALVAPNVVNDGIISAKLGKVSLSSGDKWTLDLYGDNLVSFDVTDQVNGSVTNDGVVKAGTVALTANAAKGIVGNAINMGGVIEASTVRRDGGTIILDGGVDGDVSVTGRLVARGATGGTVEVTGNTVALTGATVDASGAKGGGTIAIGGGPQGSGSLHHAQAVTVDAATKLVVDALSQGNGGAITVWSDGATDFEGTASARGGSVSGNGGGIETSGHDLNVTGGHVDTSAASGATGNWLLDPYDLSINASGASAIATALATSNVTVQTTAATSGTSSTSSYGTAISGAGGNISVNSAIGWNSANSLTLSAYNSILINQNITNTGTGGIVLRADNAGVGTTTLGAGGGSVTNSATVSTGGSVSLYYDPSGGYASPSTYTGLTGTGGVTKYMLVDNATDLANVNNMTGTYALGGNITVSGSFPGIGTSATPFSGLFDGNGGLGVNYTINGTGGTVTGTSYAGFFGYNSGTIRNLTIIGETVQGTGSFVGGIAGYNTGTISNVVFSGGSISGASMVGGITGDNEGLITGVTGTSAVNVVATSYNSSGLGGIVGNNGGTIVSTVFAGTVNGGNAPQHIALIAGNNSGLVSASTATSSAYLTGTGVNAGAGIVAVDSGNVISDVMGGTISFSSGEANSGLIVGYAYSGTISGATVLSTASGIFGAGSLGIGNILGNAAGAVVTGGTVQAGAVLSVGAGSSYIGGLIGNISSPGTTYNGSTFGGTLSVGASSTAIGGLVGYNNGGTITGGTVSGAISVGSNSQQVGGMVGYSGYGTGTSVTSKITGGTVLGTAVLSTPGGTNVGGLVGYNDAGSTIGGGTALETVTGNSTVGGYVGYNAGRISGVTATNNVFLSGAATGIGGLVGVNAATGTVLSSTASNTITTDPNNYTTTNANIGGLIGQNDGFVSAVSATGSIVSGAYADENIGGLIGYDDDAGSLSNLYANETIETNGSASIGGMFGYLSNAGGVSNATVLGSITIGNYAGGVGGFAGLAASNISNISVTEDLYVDNGNSIGGVVGQFGDNIATPTLGANVSYGGLISTSDSVSDIGGLVGESSSAIIRDGTVNASITTNEDVNDVGGLVGRNVNYGAGGIIGGGTVNVSISVGTTSTNIGGLVGEIGNGTLSGGTVLASTTMTIGSGSSAIGGLVGSNDAAGTINGGTALELVTTSGSSTVGGYVGYNAGLVTGVTATNNVSVLGDVTAIGGLVGQNDFTGTVLSSAAHNNLVLDQNDGMSGNANIGGLIGQNDGFVSAVSAVGSITSTSYIDDNIGGLIGYDDDSGSLSGLYANETIVSNGNNNIGGMFGYLNNTGGVSNATVLGSISVNAFGGDVGGFGGGVSSNISNINVTENIFLLAGGGVGGVVGVLGYNGSVPTIGANVSYTGTISTDDGVNEIGGLVGESSGGAIHDGTVNASITTLENASAVGGLVGVNIDYFFGGGIISGGTVNASITVGTTSTAIGGLVGSNFYGNKTVVISGGTVLASTTMTIGSGSSQIGGLVGYNDINSTVSGGTALETVATSGSNTVGGYVGYNAGLVTGITATNNVSVLGDVTAIGGLVGQNASTGTVLSSAAHNTITLDQNDGLAGNYNIGGLIGQNDGFVSGVSAVGSITSTSNLDNNLGGLIGYDDDTGSLSNLYADEDIQTYGQGNIGGMFGYLTNTGGVSNATVLGSITIENYAGNVGGFGGLVASNISNISVTENLNVAGGFSVGGIAGALGDNLETPTIGSHVSYTGTITTGDSVANIGGLVGGASQGVILDGTVNATISVLFNSGAIGGLAGFNGDSLISGGTVTASITVGTGSSDIGGLIGINGTTNPYGPVTVSGGTVLASTTMTIGSGSSAIGGLVGYNDVYGTISGGTALEAVTGDGSVGGLVGYNAGLVTGVTVINNVTGNPSSTAVGGIVGYNIGTVTGSSYAGTVAAGTGSFAIGGLAGFNSSSGTVAGDTGTGTVTAGTGSTFVHAVNHIGCDETAGCAGTAGQQVITVTGGAVSGTYGTAVGALGYTPSGTLESGDSYASLLSGTLTAGTAAGTYAIGQGSLALTGPYAALDYTIDYVAGTETIAKATLTVTASPESKTYGASDPTLSYTASGYQYSDGASLLSGVLGRSAGENVGSYAIGVNTLSAGSNYTISLVGNNLTIAPATLTVTATAETKTYGASDPTLAYTATGYQFSDGAGIFTGALSRVAGQNVGSYAIGQNTLSAGGNYTISYVGNNLTITTAPLTITPTGSQVYGGSNASVSYAYNGLVNGDTSGAISGVGSSTTVTNGSNAGTYGITATGGASSNYTITDATGVYIVGKAQLTVTPTGSQTYGGSNASVSYAYSGLVNGDTSGAVSGIGSSTTVTNGSNAGTYGITATGGTASNYTITDATGVYTVNDANLVITADNATRQVGQSDPVFTASFAGLVNGDMSSVVTGLSFMSTDQANSPAGPYTITAAGGSASNYLISYVAGTLTVTAGSGSPPATTSTPSAPTLPVSAAPVVQPAASPLVATSDASNPILAQVVNNQIFQMPSSDIAVTSSHSLNELVLQGVIGSDAGSLQGVVTHDPDDDRIICLKNNGISSGCESPIRLQSIR